MTPLEAKAAYEGSAGVGLHIGPHVMYGADDTEAVETLLDAQRQANRSAVSQDGVLTVPSPWHAYFYLVNASYRLNPNGYCRFLYRGQANSHKPRATLMRPGVNGRRAETVFRAFEQYARERGLSEESVSERDLRLMARHHGLASAHLDFTLDVAVALAFATSGASDDGFNRVYFTALENCLRWTDIFIPPLYAQRLLIQRGLFLEVRERDYPRLDDRLAELRFPSGYRFELCREDGRVDLYPTNPVDQFFEHTLAFAKAIEEFQETGQLDPTLQARVMQLSLIRPNAMSALFLSPDPEGVAAPLLDARVDDWWWMLAAMLFSNVSTDIDMEVDRAVVKLLCRQNRHLLQQGVEEGKSWDGGGNEALLRLHQKILRAFEEVLAESPESS